jgi:3D (Asp-Asp-Asp) domain-containing protein
MKPLLLFTILILHIPSVTYYERPPQVYREVVGIVSAYTADPNETDERYWEMANGEHVFVGAIACPPEYDFGTRVKIGDKVYTCSDRMNVRYRNHETQHFDIYMETKSEAYTWGRQELLVQIGFKK